MIQRSFISKKRAAPEWVFPWHVQKPQWFPRLVAWIIAGTAFAFLLTSVRIRVAAPDQLPARKASVIYLTDDAQGRSLSLRAREGGPFPSRFDLSQWEGLAEMEGAALASARLAPEPYVPALSDLPDATGVAPLKLAAAGEVFFPKREQPAFEAPGGTSEGLALEIHALEGITAEEMPEQLPPFEGAVDASLASSTWRFLVRLTAEGAVTECVSLERGDDQGVAELEAWLSRVRFAQDPKARPQRWISVGVHFINQTAAHGPDAR